MKKLFISALWIGLFLAFFLWRHYGGYCTGPNIPLPGPGYKAWDFFYITSGGNFRIEVEAPRKADGKDSNNAAFDSPPISCDMDLTIKDESSGKEWHRHVVQLKCGSAGPVFGYDDEDSSNWVHLPRAGKYSATLVSHARLESFERTGAMATLDKVEDPVGEILGWMFLRFLELAFLLLGTLGMTFELVRSLWKRKEQEIAHKEVS